MAKDVVTDARGFGGHEWWESTSQEAAPSPYGVLRNAKARKATEQAIEAAASAARAKASAPALAPPPEATPTRKALSASEVARAAEIATRIVREADQQPAAQSVVVQSVSLSIDRELIDALLREISARDETIKRMQENEQALIAFALFAHSFVQ